MAIQIVVGLGNPGAEYAHTRHNVGFLVIDQLVARLPILQQGKGKLLHRWLVRIDNHELLLVKPQTFMNRSGLAVRQILEERQVEQSDWLVVVDDLYLSLGSLRFREGGSAGGQRGLASIIEVLGNEQVPRLRLGVGPCPADQPHADFVLSDFALEDSRELGAAVDRAAESVILSVRQQIPFVVQSVRSVGSQE